MIRYLIDTDILTLLQQGHPAVLARIAREKPEELAIAILSVEEQLSGWYRRLRRAKNPAETARVYDHLTVAVRSLAKLPILRGYPKRGQTPSELLGNLYPVWQGV